MKDKVGKLGVYPNVRMNVDPSSSSASCAAAAHSKLSKRFPVNLTLTSSQGSSLMNDVKWSTTKIGTFTENTFTLEDLEAHGMKTPEFLEHVED